MNDDERLIHALQYKSQFDQNERHAKEWGKFLTAKQVDIDRYGEARGEILNKEKQQKLEKKLAKENNGLEEKHLQQWDKYHNGEDLTEKLMLEKQSIQPKDLEKVSVVFENNMTETLGKRPDHLKPPVKQIENPLEKTADLYNKMLLHNERQIQQPVLDLQPGVENKFKNKGLFNGEKIQQVSYDFQKEQQVSGQELKLKDKKLLNDRIQKETLKDNKADYSKNQQLQYQLNPEISFQSENRQKLENQHKTNSFSDEQSKIRADRETRKQVELNRMLEKKKLETEKNPEKER